MGLMGKQPWNERYIHRIIKGLSVEELTSSCVERLLKPEEFDRDITVFCFDRVKQLGLWDQVLTRAALLKMGTT